MTGKNRIKGWTKLNSKDLWEVWKVSFQCDDDAIAHAIWIGNRLVRDKARSSKHKFYSLKNAWLEENKNFLIDGRIARDESKFCWTCDGTGFLDEKEELKCEDCCGTGLFRITHLYEHILEINGQRYSFHSYQEPDILSDEPGADCEKYGGDFSEEELDQLALPFSGILRILDYIAHEKWEMYFDTFLYEYEYSNHKK